MSKKYDKEFKTFTEQLKYLKENYNLSQGFDPIDLYNLEAFPYYNIINGYKEFFLKNGKFENIKLENLIRIHLLDKFFLNIILKYSIFIEDIFKHKLAYTIGSKGYDYVSEKVYLDLENKELFNFKNHEILNEIKNFHSITDEQPTYFYRENHNHTPPWILFKNLNFFTVTEYYKILNINTKLKVISNYNFFSTLTPRLKGTKITNAKLDNKKIYLFLNCLNTVRKFRNRIAHNLKVHQFSINSKQSISNYDFINDFFKSLETEKKHKGDLYSCIIAIILLLDNEFLIKWFIYDIQQIIKQHLELFDTYKLMYDLPSDFFTILTKVELEYMNLNNGIIVSRFYENLKNN